MDREFALIATMTALRARDSIGELAPLLKKISSEKSDEEVKLALGSAIFEIGLFLDKIFEKYPDIKMECEERLKKYGRSYY
jgi:hypothetical protein